MGFPNGWSNEPFKGEEVKFDDMFLEVGSMLCVFLWLVMRGVRTPGHLWAVAQNGTTYVVEGSKRRIYKSRYKVPCKHKVKPERCELIVDDCYVFGGL